MHHAEASAEEIAEVIGEITIDPVNHGPVGEIAIDPKRNLPHQEIPHCIDSIEVDQAVGFHHILERFGHLLAIDRPPAMGKDRLGRG